MEELTCVAVPLADLQTLTDATFLAVALWSAAAGFAGVLLALLSSHLARYVVRRHRPSEFYMRIVLYFAFGLSLGGLVVASWGGVFS